MTTILTPPDDYEKLTDKILYEWSCEGRHLDEVHPYSLDPASAGELP